MLSTPSLSSGAPSRASSCALAYHVTKELVHDPRGDAALSFCPQKVTSRNQEVPKQEFSRLFNSGPNLSIAASVSSEHSYVSKLGCSVPLPKWAVSTAKNFKCGAAYLPRALDHELHEDNAPSVLYLLCVRYLA